MVCLAVLTALAQDTVKVDPKHWGAVNTQHSYVSILEFIVFVFRSARFFLLVRHAVTLTLNDELVEVRIFPAHDALQDSVKFGKPSFASQLDAAPDGRA